MSETAEGKIRVLLVDDHEVVRIGLRALLQRAPDLEVAGEAGSAEEAVAQAARLRPDVVVMDVRMPGGSGIEACREIRQAQPDTRVLMLTSYPDEEAVLASVMAGASGYVLKEIGGGELLAGIRAVAAGKSLLDPQVAAVVLDRVRRQSEPKYPPLTDQERRILALIAQGKTNREIAQELYLSEKTIRNYV
ncbi:MAG TPA: response regulator transcription factor, partial [Limnochordia bacterium]